MCSRALSTEGRPRTTFRPAISATIASSLPSPRLLRVSVPWLRPLPPSSSRIHTYRRKLHFVGCKGSVVKIVTPATLACEIAPRLSRHQHCSTLDRPFVKRHSAQCFYAASNRDPSRRILVSAVPSPFSPPAFVPFILVLAPFLKIFGIFGKRNVKRNVEEISLRGNQEEVR